MKFIIPFVCLITGSFARADLSPKLAEYLKHRQTEFDQIDDSRRIVLEPLAKALAQGLQGDKDTIDVTFVCTHNSRSEATARGFMAVDSVPPDHVVRGSRRLSAAAFIQSWDMWLRRLLWVHTNVTSMVSLSP